MEQISTLILHFTDTDKLSYLNDWFDAFKTDKRFKIVEINLFTLKESLSKKIKNNFDFIVLLHSVLKSLDSIKRAEMEVNFFQNRKAKLLSFVADEVNLHIVPLSKKIDFLKKIKPDYIGTQLPLEAGQWLYEDIIHAEVLPLPHALNPDVFKPLKAYNEREYDIGIISVPYPIYLGDNERNEIMNCFESISRKKNFKVKIVKAVTKSQRLSRNDWALFLNNCKGTTSSEAGTYFLEKDDKTVLEIMDYLTKKIKQRGQAKMIIDNRSKLWVIWNKLPYSFKELVKKMLFINDTVISKFSKKFVTWDGYISYDESFYLEVFEKFYKDREKNKVYTKAISSRHFDAIGTKTVQILFEGKYNDILKPDEHFIELKKDFSNLNDVLERFKDKEFVKKIVDNAYEFVLSNHTYKHRLDLIYKTIEGSI